jgi:hypothetical protein
MPDDVTAGGELAVGVAAGVDALAERLAEGQGHSPDFVGLHQDLFQKVQESDAARRLANLLSLCLGRCAVDLPLLEHREKRRQFHGESVVDRDALIGEACLGGGFLYTFGSA